MIGPDRSQPWPRTWHPRWARRVAVAVGVVLIAAVVVVWVTFPPSIRDRFGGPELAILLLFFVALLAVLYGMARTRVRADDAGLEVVNVFRTHRLAWAGVVAVNFRTSDPWVVLDVADGSTVKVMAIQSADGEPAIAAARELDRLVRAHAAPDPG